jgi:hypothetical protein
MIFANSFIAACGLATIGHAHMLLRNSAPYTSPALQFGPAGSLRQ